MSAILQIVDESLRVKLQEELKSYVGRRVFTKHARENKYYNIVGITSEPVKKLKIHRLSMAEFYWQRHHVFLSRPDLPALECDDTAMLPIELCYVSDDDDGESKVYDFADDEMEDGADQVEDGLSKMDVGGFSKFKKEDVGVDGPNFYKKDEDVGFDGPYFSKKEEDVGIDKHNHKIEKKKTTSQRLENYQKY